MDNQTTGSTNVAGDNFQIGDRVMVAVHPLLAGMSGEITALPSADAGIVALDGGARERIPLSSLELEQQAIELESEQVVALESANRSLDRATNRLILNEVPVGTSVDIETFDVEISSISSPMTLSEAKKPVEQINQHCHQIRVLLVELEIREGYKALGFSSMKQLMLSNYFVKARSTLQKELQAGRIEKEYLNLPVGTMPEGSVINYYALHYIETRRSQMINLLRIARLNFLFFSLLILIKLEVFNGVLQNTIIYYASHSFRHTYSTELLLMGVDPTHARKLTGHQSEKAFRRYTLRGEQEAAITSLSSVNAAYYRAVGEESEDRT